MGQVSTTVYTCDKDGAVSEPTTGGLPPGWSNVQASSTTGAEPPPPPVEGEPPPMPSMPIMNNVTLVLCPVCTADFGQTLTTFQRKGERR